MRFRALLAVLALSLSSVVIVTASASPAAAACNSTIYYIQQPGVQGAQSHNCSYSRARLRITCATGSWPYSTYRYSNWANLNGFVAVYCPSNSGVIVGSAVWQPG